MKQKTVDKCYIFTLIGKGNRTVAVHKSSDFPDPAQSPVVDVLLVTDLTELSHLISMEWNSREFSRLPLLQVMLVRKAPRWAKSESCFI